MIGGNPRWNAIDGIKSTLHMHVAIDMRRQTLTHLDTLVWTALKSSEVLTDAAIPCCKPSMPGD